MQELITKKIQQLTDNGKLDEIITNEATKFIQPLILSLNSY